MSIISSNKNHVIKHAKSLQIKKYRDLSNQYLIEGLKIIKEAIDYSIKFSILFISEDQNNNSEFAEMINMMKDMSIPVYLVEKKVFREISETESSQGVIGIVEKPKYEISNILEKESLKIIILEEISDPGNMGTIIRTADACNYDCIMLTKGCVDVYNSKAIRSTMGSLFHIPIISNVDIKDTTNLLNIKGIKIYGANAKYGEACYDTNFHERFAIIIGNESTGLSEYVLNTVKNMIRIPMPGRAESLNASIAASIIMYESIRKRK